MAAQQREGTSLQPRASLFTSSNSSPAHQSSPLSIASESLSEHRAMTALHSAFKCSNFPCRCSVGYFLCCWFVSTPCVLPAALLCLSACCLGALLNGKPHDSKVHHSFSDALGPSNFVLQHLTRPQGKEDRRTARLTCSCRFIRMNLGLSPKKGCVWGRFSRPPSETSTSAAFSRGSASRGDFKLRRHTARNDNATLLRMLPAPVTHARFSHSGDSDDHSLVCLYLPGGSRGSTPVHLLSAAVRDEPSCQWTPSVLDESSNPFRYNPLNSIRLLPIKLLRPTALRLYHIYC